MVYHSLTNSWKDLERQLETRERAREEIWSYLDMEDGLSQSNEIAGERDRESQLETIERATEEIWRYKIWSYLDILYTKKNRRTDRAIP